MHRPANPACFKSICLIQHDNSYWPVVPWRSSLLLLHDVLGDWRAPTSRMWNCRIDPTVAGSGFYLYAHEIPLIGSEGILLGASLKGARKCRSGRTINETVNGNQIWKVSFSCESQQAHWRSICGVVAPWNICMISQVSHYWINNQMDVDATCKYLKWKLSLRMSLQLCINPPLSPCATMWLTDVQVSPQAAGLLGWPCFHTFCSNISTSTGWTGTKNCQSKRSQHGLCWFNAVKWNPVQSTWQKSSWPLGAVLRRTALKQETYRQSTAALHWYYWR